LTKSQKLSGVVKEASYRGVPPLMKIEAPDKKMLTVLLAPWPRMEFRGLMEDMLKPGVSVSFTGVPSKSTANEFRAETITVGARTTELR
jgi:hypothetical protein